VIGGIAQVDELPGFVQCASQGDAIVVIEGQMIEALRKNEDLGHTVPATTRGRRIVASGAGIRLRRRESVKIPWEHQRRAGVRDLRASPLGLRAACPLLNGELGVEKLLPVLNQLSQRNIEFLAVCEVDGNGRFASNLRALSERNHGKNHGSGSREPTTTFWEPLEHWTVLSLGDFKSTRGFAGHMAHANQLAPNQHLRREPPNWQRDPLSFRKSLREDESNRTWERRIKMAILFFTDLGKMADAGLCGIGNKSEPVAIRQRCHVAPWRGGGNLDSGDVLDKGSAHAISWLVGTLFDGSPAHSPFDIKRVNDSPYLINRPSDASNAVRNRERIQHAYISCMEPGASIIEVRVSASFWN